MSVLANIQTGALRAVDPNFTPGWTTFPGDSASQTRVIVNDSNVIVVNAATKYPEQARTFLNFIGQQDQQAIFAKASGGLSPYDIKTCAFDPELLSRFVAPCKAGELISAKTGSWPNPNMGLGYLNTSLQALFLGQINVDTILKGLDYMWDHPDASAPPS
jgi:ABC-type glycerol-3-phosphate transport system substrate-binding protein